MKKLFSRNTTVYNKQPINLWRENVVQNIKSLQQMRSIWSNMSVVPLAASDLIAMH